MCRVVTIGWVFFASTCFSSLVRGVESTTNSSDPYVSEDELNQRNIYTECTSPTGDDGFCMEIKKCVKLLNLLTVPDAHEFLRNSSCGSMPGWVCCGKHDAYVSPKPKNTFHSDHNIASRSPILPANCGKQTVIVQNRILGGNESSFGEFPWMARLLHMDKNGYENYGCAGFLIHKRFILTAAHCVKSKLFEVLGPIKKIILGEFDTTSDPDCVNLNETSVLCAPPILKLDFKAPITHPSYDPESRSQHHDIALIPLKTKLSGFNDYVSPICLADLDSLNNAVGFEITGWGRTNESESSTKKLKVDVPPFDFRVCQQQFRPLKVNITDTQICAGGIEGQDSCAGDSGGPLMYFSGDRWYSAGIVSFGVGCGKKSWPAVYTNILQYKTWITQTIEDVNARNFHQSQRNRRRV